MNTDNLWNHLFPDGAKKMVELKKKYFIIERKKINTTADIKVNEMELIKAELQPVVVIDTDEVKGVDSFVLGVSNGKERNKLNLKKSNCIFQSMLFRNPSMIPSLNRFMRTK